MKIAICDDCEIICQDIEAFLRTFAQKHGIKIEEDTFYSGEELLKAMVDGSEYDVVLLDIELAELNGVEVGKSIRNIEKKQTDIIYISGNDGYAMSLFEISPMDFLIKPIQEERLAKNLVKTQKRLENERRHFEYKNGKYLERILYNDILYFNSKGKKIHIYKTNGTVVEFYGKMTEIESVVPTVTFLKTHKSFLVNIDHIERYEYKEIKLDNQMVLPISQTQRKKVREQLISRV